MTSFFKQLINIGDEPTTENPVHSINEIEKMSRAELIKELTKMYRLVDEKEQERQKLYQECLSIRSEYEAYKKKVEIIQAQNRETRIADKKLIEELRTAGNTGKVDETYIKSTNETIEKLKISLREAQDAASNAYRRQREAEENRVAIEKTSKQEYDSLFGKFNNFKERMKETQAKYEAQILELQQKVYFHTLEEKSSVGIEGVGNNLNLNATNVQNFYSKIINSSENESDKHNKESKSSETLNTEKNTANDSEVNADPNSYPSKRYSGNDIRIDDSKEDEVKMTVSSADSPETSNFAGKEDYSSKLLINIEEINNLKNQLKTAFLREHEILTKSNDAESKIRALNKDIEWSAIEHQKSIAELTGTIDSLKAKCGQMESKIELKTQENETLEKRHKSALRDLEDSLAAEKRKFATYVREAETREQKLADQLQQERDKLILNTNLVDEAEQMNQRNADSLENQRLHYETQLSQREARIKELYYRSDSHEAMISEYKADIRRLEDLIADQNRQINKYEETLVENEHQMAETYRTLSLREEYLQEREKERTNLRSNLKNEEERNIYYQSAVRDLEQRVSELQNMLSHQESVNMALMNEKRSLIEEQSILKNKDNSLEHLINSKESQIEDLTKKLNDQGNKNFDITKLRENQASLIKNYEKRFLELQQTISRNNGSDSIFSQKRSNISDSSNTSKGIGIGNTLFSSNTQNNFEILNRYEKQKQFLNDVYTSTRSPFILKKNYRQIGLLILVAFFSIFIIMLWSSTAFTESETLANIKEKYTQSIQQVNSCQSALASVKAKLGK